MDQQYPLVRISALLDELERIHEAQDEPLLEKVAVDPLTLAAAGLGMHAAANAILKHTHHSKLLSKIRGKAFAEGVEQAITGKRRPLLYRFREAWLAPELTGPEEFGRVIGKGLAELPARKMRRALKKLRKAVASSPELRTSPIFEDVVPGVNQLLKKPLPRPGVPLEETAFHKNAPYAAAPIMAAAHPASLVHGTLSKLRLALARSKWGQKYMRNAFIRGSKMGYRGVEPDKVREALFDYALSPAALDTERFGRVIGEMARKEEGRRALKRLSGALHSIYEPQVRAMAGKVHNVNPNILPALKILSSNPMTDIALKELGSSLGGLTTKAKGIVNKVGGEKAQADFLDILGRYMLNDV